MAEGVGSWALVHFVQLSIRKYQDQESRKINLYATYATHHQPRLLALQQQLTKRQTQIQILAPYTPFSRGAGFRTPWSEKTTQAQVLELTYFYFTKKVL
jgi:hypothetical protein